MDKVVDAASHISSGGVNNHNYAPKNTILCLCDSDDKSKGGDNDDKRAGEAGVMSTPRVANALLASVDRSASRVFILGFECVEFDNIPSERCEYLMSLLRIDTNKYEHELRQFEEKGRLLLSTRAIKSTTWRVDLSAFSYREIQFPQNAI
jgi:hypothetical protein